MWSLHVFPVPGIFQVVRLPPTVQLIGYLVLDGCEEGKCITELEFFSPSVSLLMFGVCLLVSVFGFF